MRRLLLHACCGPCATYTVQRLRQQDFDVTAFWYNPNVHPFTEHQARLEAMVQFARDVDLPLVVAEGYEMLRYFRAVVGHEGERCRDCYRLRLSETAARARELGIEFVTTTLLISPYQDQDLLRQIGQEVAAEHGVAFHFEDFTPGFWESQRLSRELGLYHQKYCGCIFSEWERFGKVDIAEQVAKLEESS